MHTSRDVPASTSLMTAPPGPSTRGRSASRTTRGGDVESSSSHLGEVLAQLSRQPVKMVLRTAYQDGRSSEWLAERAKIHTVALPFTVGGSEQARDLFTLFDDTLQKLLAAAK